MPKSKKEKPLIGMTSKELAEHVFGKELKEKLDEIAHEEKPVSKRSPQSSQK